MNSYKLNQNSVKSSFVDAANNLENPSSNILRQFGENNHPELTVFGLGDNLLALFDILIRDLIFNEDQLRYSINLVLNDVNIKKDIDLLKNLFVLAFQTRWCRGGKGERLLSYKMLKILYEKYPNVVISLIPLLPEYGYWGDLNNLVKECIDNPVSNINYQSIYSTVWKTFAQQMKIDLVELDKANNEKRTANLTFCFKYVPSEGHSYDKKIKNELGIGSVDFICKELFPDIVGDILTTATPKQRTAAWRNAKSLYRNQCTKVRSALDIPEVKECAHRFAEINFSKMPARCLKNKMKAYLNEKLNQSPSNELNGNRFPNDEDRITARNNLLAVLKDVGVNGSQCDPHELVNKVLGKLHLSTGVKTVINSQWISLRDNVLAMIHDRRDKINELENQINTDTGNLIVMSDVSGSMSGDPILVSIGMGILISEICHPAFRDLVLTFSTNPIFHDLSKCSTFCEKVYSLSKADWGGSTNFEAAMNKIALIVESKKLKNDEIPNLLIVSDMQFDQARSSGYYSRSTSSSWATSYERIKNMFNSLGLKIHGTPLDPPKIIFWNVRAKTGFPASSDQEGVMLMSGYSPSLMKFILSGEMEIKDELGNSEQITPMQTLNKILNDPGLNPVRDILDSELNN
tara:strand:- start:96 stop:1991 length:1896 start_codon:yes stop_codon:yes gene_type:complete